MASINQTFGQAVKSHLTDRERTVKEIAEEIWSSIKSQEELYAFARVGFTIAVEHVLEEMAQEERLEEIVTFDALDGPELRYRRKPRKRAVHESDEQPALPI